MNHHCLFNWPQATRAGAHGVLTDVDRRSSPHTPLSGAAGKRATGLAKVVQALLIDRQTGAEGT